ncbi:ROK family protein [Microbacterium algeriense]|uniref:ROK family protein n=1 Tax=Microbacterium algeriense TaxID=2615184 RepID=A0ABQ6V780_9MICO|nr:ROK family protein [Microbacterium algeriense]KAB1866285.1 ROK family protein [Microbacterium algeriense]
MELCIDFGGTEIKLAVIDGHRVLASGGVAVQGGPSDLAAAAVEARRLLEQTGAPEAVGIAVPGVVEPGTGRMLHANAKYDFLRDLDLSAWSLAEFGVPAAVENDARAALIGETSTGSAAGTRDAVLVTLGTGIGTAVLMGGMPLRGRTGHAGILGGHLTVDLDGPVCPCGNIGCGEALASTWALGASTGDDSSTTRPEDEAAHVGGASTSSATRVQDSATQDQDSATQDQESPTQDRGSATRTNGSATQDQDSATQDQESPTQHRGSATRTNGSATQPNNSATQDQGSATQAGRVTMAEVFAGEAHREIRERYLRVWGAVVTSLVHSYDPAVVILSGGILRAGDAVSAPIEAYVRAHLWPSLTPPRFVVPPEPELSVARGLSVLARAGHLHTATPQEEQ